MAILWLAVGLAMDATAVASARGVAASRVTPIHALKIALLFGGAQALMPLLAWLIGARVGPWVAAWDHWIAFVLLGGLGAKMLWEARAGDDDEAPREDEPFAWRVLLVLAVATSIDAFAVGLTLPMIGAPLVLSLVTIGVVTALLSAGGLFAGSLLRARSLGASLGKRLDVVGGVVLIGLGAKILIEHLTSE